MNSPIEGFNPARAAVGGLAGGAILAGIGRYSLHVPTSTLASTVAGGLVGGVEQQAAQGALVHLGMSPEWAIGASALGVGFGMFGAGIALSGRIPSIAAFAMFGAGVGAFGAGGMAKNGIL